MACPSFGCTIGFSGKHAPGQDRLGPESTIPTIEMLLRFGWTAFESDAMVNRSVRQLEMVKNVQASSCSKRQ